MPNSPSHTASLFKKVQLSLLSSLLPLVPVLLMLRSTSFIIAICFPYNCIMICIAPFPAPIERASVHYERVCNMNVPCDCNNSRPCTASDRVFPTFIRLLFLQVERQLLTLMKLASFHDCPRIPRCMHTKAVWGPC